MIRILLAVCTVASISACGNRSAPPPEPWSAQSSGEVRTVRVAAATEEDSCTLEFTGPGGTCGEWGECPERVHRSLLWGLIEYETDIIVCFCLVECEIDLPLIG